MTRREECAWKEIDVALGLLRAIDEMQKQELTPGERRDLELAAHIEADYGRGSKRSEMLEMH